MSDDDLGALAGLAAELRAVGRAVDDAVPAGLADRVMAAINDDAAPPAVNGAVRPLPTHPAGRTDGRLSRPPRAARARRIVSAIATLLLLVAAVVAVASPPVRAAIRHLFAGVEIHHGAPPAPASSPALPGEHPTDLAGAARAVGFPVLVPAALGPPDGVTVVDGRVVSLTWHRAGQEIRLDEFAGDLGVMFEKYALGAATRTAVGGAPALWFGDGTIVEYVGPDGRMYSESTRRTGRTLIWTVGRITLRLDGMATEADAVATASTAK